MSRFEDLLTGCKRQNRQSMMELYDICCLPVFNASLHIVANQFDAEEIMQDSILKAFDNIDRFQGTERDFVAFVKRIAINKSIDLFRKNSKEPFFDDITVDGYQSADSDLDVEEETQYSVEHIIEKIELLPVGYKMVLKLHLLDELDFAEIAKLMNIKASTVRSQYVRAKERLKEELEIVETFQCFLQK
ncbi:MAG: RNA polymerase sigma factor [Bacteroidales bacterium]|nr:RNA polymerase sigma factor [Bacteroidales bacterium]